MNLRATYSRTIVVPGLAGDTRAALSALTEAAADRLKAAFATRNGIPESNPVSGTIVLAFSIPDQDGEVRDFRVLIAFHVAAVGQDGSVVFSPRVFAEVVRRKQSTPWVEGGPENDLIRVIDEVSAAIANAPH